jgi:hypothetical protein
MYMSDVDPEAIIRHIRGATVVHQSPFSSIEVPAVDDALTVEQCEKWVEPFYRVSFQWVDEPFHKVLKKIYPEISPAMVELLLTDYNWRPRLTGAFFAALKKIVSLEDHIGKLLLRSDLCYAGSIYCVALAEFNTPIGLGYLKKYLDYYLTRPDLDYNQIAAMGAIAYLDGRNGTKYLEEFAPKWTAYWNANLGSFELSEAIHQFANEMRALHECRARAEAV